MKTDKKILVSSSSEIPMVAVRRPYSAPLLTRFGCVQELTLKSGSKTDVGHPTRP
jgi:hypothetical protein